METARQLRAQRHTTARPLRARRPGSASTTTRRVTATTTTRAVQARRARDHDDTGTARMVTQLPGRGDSDMASGTRRPPAHGTATIRIFASTRRNNAGITCTAHYMYQEEWDGPEDLEVPD
ncbi:hypothetical protein BDZ89DRAFT_1044170 [Hymenopellis radicata]|nr:hypothetical protein BDZ89DRAFT_1044170 [Hymenopellis radicata]